MTRRLGAKCLASREHEHEARLADLDVSPIINIVFEEVRLLRRRGWAMDMPRTLGRRRGVANAPVPGAGARRGCPALLAHSRGAPLRRSNL